MSKEQEKVWNIPGNYKMKLIKWGIIAVIGIAVFLVIFFKGYSNATKKYEDELDRLHREIEEMSEEAAEYTYATKEVMMNLIHSEISEIGELATVEYMYTDAGKFEDAKQFFGVDVPFTKKYFIAKWDGTVKAGVKMEQIMVEVDDTQKVILIKMPPAEILSHEIDNESIETLDEKDGLFNKITLDNTREFDAISKEAMEARAIENGILEKAFENAKGIIAKLVNNEMVQKQGYVVEFEKVE